MTFYLRFIHNFIHNTSDNHSHILLFVICLILYIHDVTIFFILFAVFYNFFFSMQYNGTTPQQTQHTHRKLSHIIFNSSVPCIPGINEEEVERLYVIHNGIAYYAIQRLSVWCTMYIHVWHVIQYNNHNVFHKTIVVFFSHFFISIRISTVKPATNQTGTIVLRIAWNQCDDVTFKRNADERKVWLGWE